MATLNEIIEAAEKIESKQAQADYLTTVIQKLDDATDVNGDVELKITRTNEIFVIDTTTLTNKLTNKRDNLNTQIANLISKITIAP